jgi:hypothetical protein
MYRLCDRFLQCGLLGSGRRVFGDELGQIGFERSLS